MTRFLYMNADVELTDDGAELTFYVAYPIPAFAGQGAERNGKGCDHDNRRTDV